MGCDMGAEIVEGRGDGFLGQVARFAGTWGDGLAAGKVALADQGFDDLGGSAGIGFEERGEHLGRAATVEVAQVSRPDQGVVGEGEGSCRCD